MVRRCRRCVSFWLACVVLRSSVVRARRLGVRSGLVVIAARLGCIMSPWSVWDGDDVLAEVISALAVGVFVAGSTVWAGSLDSWRGCVGGLVGELRPVGVGVGCPDAVGVAWTEGHCGCLERVEIPCGDVHNSW